VKIRWTPIAAEDLKSAYEYVAERNPTGADGLVDRILSTIDLLQRHPEMGRPGRVNATRELVVPGTPFLVVYRIHRNQVQVLSVLHAARKWPNQF
jgi:toxin ParE1/3/4